MRITVDIPDELAPEVETRLAAEADALGLSLDRYMLEKLIGTQSDPPLRQRTVGEAIDKIRELRKGNRLHGLRIKDLIEEGRSH